MDYKDVHATFDSRRKLMQMELLYDIGLELSSTLDPELLTNEILYRSAMMVDARSVALIVRDSDGQFLLSEQVANRPAPHNLFVLDELSAVWENGSSQDVTLGSNGWDNLHVMRLSTTEQIKGLLVIADKEHADGSTGPFDAGDKALLMAFTNQAGIALQNAELHHNLQETYAELEKSDFEKRRKLLQMEMLYEIGLELSGSLDPTLILDEILNRSLIMVDARSAALIIRNEAKGRFEVSNEASADVFPVAILDDPILDQVWTTRSALSFERDALAWSHIFILPVCSQDYIGGLLVVADKEERGGLVVAFDEEDRSLLQSFAYQAGSALNNAVLYRDLGASLEDLRKSQASQEFVQNAFGNYLSPLVVEQIIKNPELIKERGGRSG